MAAKPIVVGVDGSDLALRAVDWAAREAALRGLPLKIVSGAALPPKMMDRRTDAGPDIVSDTVLKGREQDLAAAAERAAAAAPDLPVDVEASAQAPATALINAGTDASMLVVGARGVGTFTAMILGSVSLYVSAQATCPVVVVREETTATHRQVGVGIGDPARSAAALAFAFEEAALRKASLIAVHAQDTPGGQVGAAVRALATPGRSAVAEAAAEKLDTMLADWQDRYPDVPVTHDFVQGHPGRALVGLSARADLVVLGRHLAQAALPGVGAIRHAVLHHAHGPIVIVPSS